MSTSGEYLGYTWEVGVRYKDGVCRVCVDLQNPEEPRAFFRRLHQDFDFGVYPDNDDYHNPMRRVMFYVGDGTFPGGDSPEARAQEVIRALIAMEMQT